MCFLRSLLNRGNVLIRVIETMDDSGMKGVDFGSFPLISKWIKESIFESLRDYVTPKYISFDVLAWLNGDSRIVSYMT
jgi:hypothetical protein